MDCRNSRIPSTAGAKAARCLLMILTVTSSNCKVKMARFYEFVLFWLVTQSFLVGEERLRDEPTECLRRKLIYTSSRGADLKIGPT